jgi:hypothetical protein
MVFAMNSDNTTVPSEQFYETPDSHFGSFLLYHHVPYKGCRFGSAKPGQVIFQFENDPHIPQLRDEFANSSNSNARALFGAHSFLKAEIQRLRRGVRS